MVSRSLSVEREESSSAAGSTGDHLHASTQVVAQVHHADLVFVTHLADASVVNASERFFHKRKGVFDSCTGLGLAGIGLLLIIRKRGGCRSFFVDVIVHTFGLQIRRYFFTRIGRVRVSRQIPFFLSNPASADCRAYWRRSSYNHG